MLLQLYQYHIDILTYLFTVLLSWMCLNVLLSFSFTSTFKTSLLVASAPLTLSRDQWRMTWITATQTHDLTEEFWAVTEMLCSQCSMVRALWSVVSWRETFQRFSDGSRLKASITSSSMFVKPGRDIPANHVINIHKGIATAHFHSWKTTPIL